MPLTPTLLRGMLSELAQQALPQDREALRDLVAVDGSVRRAWPSLAWCPGPGATGRATKRHVAFEVFRGGPADATVTSGYASERQQLRDQRLRKDRSYVVEGAAHFGGM